MEPQSPANQNSPLPATVLHAFLSSLRVADDSAVLPSWATELARHNLSVSLPEFAVARWPRTRAAIQQALDALDSSSERESVRFSDCLQPALTALSSEVCRLAAPFRVDPISPTHHRPLPTL